MLAFHHDVLFHRPLDIVQLIAESIGIEAVVEEVLDNGRRRFEEHFKVFHVVHEVANLVLIALHSKLDHDFFETTVLVVHGAEKY